MMEKILNLNGRENLSNIELSKLHQDLQRIEFFSEANGEDCHPKYHHNKQIFTILKNVPDPKDRIHGGNYIREEWVNGSNVVYACIYDFDLRVISTCS